MKNADKIQLLEKRIFDLEKVIKKDHLLLTNPENENSTVFIGIKDNKLITEGVLLSQSQVILPISNQSL